MDDTQEQAAPAADSPERFRARRVTLSTEQLVEVTCSRSFWDRYICAVVDDIVLGRSND
jgi:hypothetical protein